MTGERLTFDNYCRLPFGVYVEEHNASAQATYERLGLKVAGYLVMESLKTNY